MTDKITAYKGFDKDMRCRGFQYEVGQTYEHKGEVVACGSGFHACLNPLDVFSYYEPGISKFAQVEMSGTTDDCDSDSKIAAAKITIVAEISMPDYIKKAIEWVTSRCASDGSNHATGYRSASSATGTSSASLTTGAHGTSEIVPDKDGEQLHASAIAAGYKGKAKAPKSCALFLVERNDDDEIINVFAGVVGRDGIKEDTFYMLVDGKPIEA